MFMGVWGENFMSNTLGVIVLIHFFAMKNADDAGLMLKDQADHRGGDVWVCNDARSPKVAKNQGCEQPGACQLEGDPFAHSL